MIHYSFHLQGRAVQFISVEQKQEEFVVIPRDCLLRYLSLVKCWLIVSLKQLL